MQLGIILVAKPTASAVLAVRVAARRAVRAGQRVEALSVPGAARRWLSPRLLRPKPQVGDLKQQPFGKLPPPGKAGVEGERSLPPSGSASVARRDASFTEVLFSATAWEKICFC